MSEFLFPHSQIPQRTLKLRLAALGMTGGLLLSLVLGILALQTIGVLSNNLRVTVQLPTVGDTLGINSDVKYNGLRVGRVIEVDPVAREAETGWDGPTAVVLVEPDHAELIPAGVKARVLPGTLFGNEYVDLVVTGATGSTDAATAAATTGTGGISAAGAHLSDGDVVEADTSVKTLRLMDTFSATQRLLAAVDPAQWDVALSQLADSLDGRGLKLAEMIEDGGAFLGRWEDVQPQLQEDMDLLAETSELFADVEPQLIQALRDTRPLARTLVEQQTGTRALLQGLPALLDGPEGITEFLRTHGDATARLLNATAANLEVFAQRYPSFAQLLQKVPALLRNGAAAVKGGNIQMEGVISPALVDAYDDADCPDYRGLRGPCGGGAR
ncbi:MCE family protein [Nocardioides caeni]|uniref:MCE family protein n=1 Tax=Nocardioides caeni TaxID=574700 RepID=A0A4S8NMN0_9ACTN|nr:MCE family protein [Nocardioides caeni]THV18233.1 MCE family protein [Nocardioides caeni]